MGSVFVWTGIWRETTWIRLAREAEPAGLARMKTCWGFRIFVSSGVLARLSINVSWRTLRNVYFHGNNAFGSLLLWSCSIYSELRLE